MKVWDSEIERLKNEKYGGEPKDEDKDSFASDMTRLENGEPVEYVIGKVNFLDTIIDLSMRPMIPREETAFWVKRAIGELKAREEELGRPLRLADSYSGSGNVGIALLKHLPTASVDICELDAELIPQIQKSVEINNLSGDRVKVFSADGFLGLTGTYDAIFANPPYIDIKDREQLDYGMIHFEPQLAFFAEDEGRQYHKIIISTGYDLLNDGGAIYMEADLFQGEGIKKMVEGTKWKLEFWPDPYGANPFVVLRK